MVAETTRTSACFALLDPTRYESFTPRMPARLADGSLYSAIRSADVLLHHPYDSFMPVLDFLTGTLTVRPTLAGSLSASPSLSGTLELEPT